MKKRMILFMLLMILTAAASVFAQAETAEPTLYEQFPVLKYRNYFYQATGKHYYRFPSEVLFFEPLDLKYFPHESWNMADWSLLGRWEDSWNYTQLIMMNNPVGEMAAHGTAVGREYGYLSDFYLYATLFVADNYPENTGSCYVYYSDSLLTGFGNSTGIFIDPQFGVSEVDNHYESVYRLTNSTHEFTLLKDFTMESYPISESDIAASSIGANDFPHETIDQHFADDWAHVQESYRMAGSSVKAYRLEIVRKGTIVNIYINGIPAVSFDDGILKSSKNGFSPSKVSWSFGPVLYEGGQTVSCLVGDLYIWGPAE